MSDSCQVTSGQSAIIVTDADGNQITVPRAGLRDLISDLLLALGVPPLPDLANLVIAAPDANVRSLTELGNEWSRPAKKRRPAMRRIYFEPLQGWWGLLIEPGRNAQFRGEAITELEARAIIARFREAKVYFDVNKSKFCGENIDHDAFVFIVEQIRTLERSQPDDPA